ncbi:adenine deaminase [Sulfobacillus thermosulfidooxidans]|uniref:adenine deaminase n=1 Tax=Sulfobacillus thermosulfidooxidans TaxID=28034 RepID=UPI000421E662|nr:adenine deaminase [Sulfobacillus thermosulfidooxidans]
MTYNSEIRRQLAQVALGNLEPDLVITHAQLVNVHTKEIEPDVSVAVKSGFIAYIGKSVPGIKDTTKVIDAHQQYLVPGLIDGHMHVESSMLSVAEFARAVLPFGTTTIFMDPHEMANVFGLEGVALMMHEAEHLPLRVFTTVPSCVPAAPGLEDSGQYLGPNEVHSALNFPRVAGLSEVMDFPGVVNGNPEVLEKIRLTYEKHQVVTGHLPTSDDRVIQAYAATGIFSDHESTSREEALAKARRGITVMIREGTAWKDVHECIKIVTEDGIDPHQCLLVTDDVEPATLVQDGHLNVVVRRAIEEGVDALSAIQMATINTARYFHVEDWLGSIAPGHVADMLLIPDLMNMRPSVVFAGGEIVAENGQFVAEITAPSYPDYVKKSVHLPRAVTAQDFFVKSESCSQGEVTVRAIGVNNNSALTHLYTSTARVEEGVILPSLDNDLVYAAVLERHHGSGQIGRGFVHGFGIKRGAVASTVGHDSHNLMVMGVNPTDMAMAANALAQCGGGMVAVLDQTILALVSLPVAGLMAEESAQVMAEKLERLTEAWRRLGCTLHAPYMTFSLIALPVIPELRLSNKGLVDVMSMTLVPVEVL